jgi:hypothetical protein
MNSDTISFRMLPPRQGDLATVLPTLVAGGRTWPSIIARQRNPAVSAFARIGPEDPRDRMRLDTCEALAVVSDGEPDSRCAAKGGFTSLLIQPLPKEGPQRTVFARLFRSPLCVP